MGWKGVRRYGCGGRQVIYLSLQCRHQNDSCIKMGSDESHFNVSLIVRDKVRRQCPQTTTFEEKGEPKRIRTEVLRLTSLTPYRQAIQAHFYLFFHVSLFVQAFQRIAYVTVFRMDLYTIYVQVIGIGNTQISILLLCFLYLFVELMITMNEYNFV